MIGSGGMGSVYLAADKRLHRRRRVEVHPAGPDRGRCAVVARLLNEARASSALNDPNVCQVYDVGGEGRESWIAMEYVEGRPLSALVRPAMPMHDVVRLGMQIADGLAHAHSRGILHRDLKTATSSAIRLGGRGSSTSGLPDGFRGRYRRSSVRRAVPVDPGFAGTLAYMAPEVVGERRRTSAPICGRSAWCCTRWRLASGRFTATTYRRRRGDRPRSPSPLPDDVPAPFASIVMRLLAKSPVERYPTAGEVAAALAAPLDRIRFVTPRAPALSSPGRSR